MSRFWYSVFTFGAVALSLFLVQGASGAIVLPNLGADGSGELLFLFENHESLVDVTGNADFLEVGDRLRGTVKIQSITSPNGSTIWADYTGNAIFTGGAAEKMEVTGLFDITVLSRTLINNGPDSTGGTGDDVYSYIFGATGNLDSHLTGLGMSQSDIDNTALVLLAEELESGTGDTDRYSSGSQYQDPPDTTSGANTIPNAVADATGGQVYGALGGTFTANPATSDVYWTGIGTQDPAQIDTISTGDALFGMNFLYNGTGADFLRIANDPNESTFDDTVDAYANADLEAATNGPFQVRSDDPVHVYTPEASAFLIWGTLLALAAAVQLFRRRGW